MNRLKFNGHQEGHQAGHFDRLISTGSMTRNDLHFTCSLDFFVLFASRQKVI
ncbi:MAG TPA: hypothetical protein VLH61_07910 [Bacteroidales bacterium]|nr:hypothetical protein [Bacteroidales bacterium]